MIANLIEQSENIKSSSIYKDMKKNIQKAEEAKRMKEELKKQIAATVQPKR